MTVTYTTLTVARAPSTVTFTVRGNLGAIVGANLPASNLTLVDNGDGTFTASGASVVDNGDGTFTINDPAVTDNGDGTYTITA